MSSYPESTLSNEISKLKVGDSEVSKRNELSQRASILERENILLKEENGSLKKEHILLKNEYSRRRKEVFDITERNVGLEKQLSRVTSSANENIDQLKFSMRKEEQRYQEKYEQKLLKQRSRISELEERTENLENMNRNLLLLNDELREENIYLKERVNSLGEQITELRDIINRRSELQDIANQKHDAEISKLNGEIIDLHTEIDETKLWTSRAKENHNLLLIRQIAFSYQHKAAAYVGLKDTGYLHQTTPKRLRKEVGKSGDTTKYNDLMNMLSRSSGLDAKIDDVIEGIRGIGSSHPQTELDEKDGTVKKTITVGQLEKIINDSKIREVDRKAALALLPILDFLSVETGTGLLQS